MKRLVLLTTVMIFASAAVGVADEEWPREIETAQGLVVLYQPQVDVLEGDILSARAAVSIKPKGQDEPIFGAAWLEARIDTDLDTRTVILDEVRVPRVRFQGATDEQQQELTDLLTAEIPTWDIELSLDELMASLEIAERQSLAATGFDDSPPVILFTDEPTVLISIDGEPRLQELERNRRAGGRQLAVSCSRRIPIKKRPLLPLRRCGHLVRGPRRQGPVEFDNKGAEEDQTARTRGRGDRTRGRGRVARRTARDCRSNRTHRADRHGRPAAVLPLADGYAPDHQEHRERCPARKHDPAHLRAALRTLVRSQVHQGAMGVWWHRTHCPRAFPKSNPDSDYGYLLTWVAGSELAEETSLDSYVPQTAAIKRSATIEVTYDGEPKFEPIEETSLYYAVNTESQVIRAGSEYYCAEDGIWYVADDPNGPVAGGHRGTRRDLHHPAVEPRTTT